MCWDRLDLACDIAIGFEQPSTVDLAVSFALSIPWWKNITDSTTCSEVYASTPLERSQGQGSSLHFVEARGLVVTGLFDSQHPNLAVGGVIVLIVGYLWNTTAI